MALDRWRQTDIVKSDALKDIKVHLIGCGGIGSPTALALTKMGIQTISLYDDDKVEPHNLPNQFYRSEDLNVSKAAALQSICEAFSEVTPTVVEGRVTAESDHTFEGVVISGVDSMKSRNEIWTKLKYNVNVPMYIDARMAAETMKILTINPCDPDHVKFYETQLYSDEETSELPCTARAIIYNTLLIASLITNQVKKFVMSEEIRHEIIFDLKNLMLL